MNDLLTLSPKNKGPGLELECGKTDKVNFNRYITWRTGCTHGKEIGNNGDQPLRKYIVDPFNVIHRWVVNVPPEAIKLR
jgi:hypothetical protein